MKWYWTWSGKCFGFRKNDKLFTHAGIQAAQFHGDLLFGADGMYLGEVMSDDRLIVKKSNPYPLKSRFHPERCMGYISFTDYIGNVMINGYEDFPSPEKFK